MELDVVTGRVVVVGAGHSGEAFALTLRKLGVEGAPTAVGDEHERPALSKSMPVDDQATPVFLAATAR